MAKNTANIRRCEVESAFCVPSQPQGGSVGRVVPTHFFCAALRAAGRSVGSTRGQPESVADALGRQGGSVGRVVPTQFFAAALRAAVGRSG